MTEKKYTETKCSFKLKCPGGCSGNGYIKVRIPPEKRPAVVYDNWSENDYFPCTGKPRDVK